LVAYGLLFASMLAALIRAGAPRRWLLAAALLALPLLLVAGLLISLLATPLSASHRLQFAVSMLLMILTGYAAGRLLASWRPTAGTRLRRGAVVGPAVLRARGEEAGLTLAGVPIAPADETKHFKLIGTTGTGKSTAIRELLGAALRRGDAAIVADPDGGYLARYYDAARGDVILNPFDGEARKWDLFAEISHDYDVEQLARSLIPDHGARNAEWPGYARTLFSSVTHQLLEGGIRDDEELFRLLTRAPQAELRSLLAGTVAGPFLETGNERMFGSVRSVMSSALGVLNYTTRQQAASLSVKQWVRDTAARTGDAPRGVLFLPYKAGEIAALRSVISAWLRLAIFEAMDREEGDQRLWFIVDELDALGEIDGLKDALTRLRKFGGRCILGFQSIAQVSATYGKGNADTIVENCGNTLILRCSASEHGGTSEFAARLIGQREVVHTTRSRSRAPGQWQAVVTSSEQLRSEPAVMASEIERLPDLDGFLKLASIPNWQAVRLIPDGPPPAPRARRPSVFATERPHPAGSPDEVPAASPRRRGAKKPAAATSRPLARKRGRPPVGGAVPGEESTAE
jgi:type IV secretory pathway TraG/TraD family ATPase VirD4